MVVHMDLLLWEGSVANPSNSCNYSIPFWKPASNSWGIVMRCNTLNYIVVSSLTSPWFCCQSTTMRQPLQETGWLVICVKYKLQRSLLLKTWQEHFASPLSLCPFILVTGRLFQYCTFSESDRKSVPFYSWMPHVAQLFCICSPSRHVCLIISYKTLPAPSLHSDTLK